MTQKILIINGTKEGASSIIFPNNIKLSSSKNGWNDIINFEYNYQQAAFVSEHQNTKLIIAKSIRSTAIFHILQNYSNQKIIDINTPDGLPTQSLKKVIDYIHNNFQEDFGLAELASLVGLSSRYFSKLFKSSTGFSPFDYLLKFRLSRASQLLLTTKLPIFDVARRTGFSSSNNFCRAFRKYYSISPNKYRELEKRWNMSCNS